jgi:hypothetical protein
VWAPLRNPALIALRRDAMGGLQKLWCFELLGIFISNGDKIQFYMEQIYVSNMFDKNEMVDWENKPILIKDDYTKQNSISKNS